MLNPPIKTCKTCDKTPMKGRRFCLSCIREQEKEKVKEKKKQEKIKVRKEKSVDKKRFSKASLVKEADRVFSLYIRARDKGKPCITCWAPWQENFQCWHFMSRRHVNTRWLERNAHSQCPKDNLYGAWEQFLHAKAIDALYGSGVSDKICELANLVGEVDILEEIRHYYKKLEEMWVEFTPKKYYR